MSEHIRKAKESIQMMGGISEAYALIAIAEQLQLANLIAVSESGRSTVNGARAALNALYSGDESEGSATRHLKLEVAELLGVEHE